MIVRTVPNPPSDTRNRHYITHRAPLAPAPLVELPLGSVRPRGWLRNQAALTAEGLAGRLEEVSPFLQQGNGWLDPSNYGWEEAPYWLRGMYDIAAFADIPRCTESVGRYIEAALTSQDADGYFGPGALKRIQGYGGRVVADLFPHSLMVVPLIHHFELTGDERVIPFLRRFFSFCASLPDDEFIPASTVGNFGWGGAEFGDVRPFIQYARAGEMIPSIYWLYNVTGEARLLDLARRFHQSIRPPWDEWLDHHAVNFPNRFAYAAIYSTQSGESWQRESAEYWYRQHLATWGQMPGGIFAADERIRPGCTDPRFGYETCGMVELARSFTLLSRVDGSSKWAQRTEEVMYNHFPATHAPDLRSVHYITAANQPILSGIGKQLHRNNVAGKASFVGYTAKNRCCGHNGGYGWSVVIKNLWQATADNGLCLWAYGPSEVTAAVGDSGESVSIVEETEYPFSGSVELRVSTSSPVRFPLYLRIPEWCRTYRIGLNGETVGEYESPSSYLCVDRVFSDRDVIRIEMEMEIEVKRWPRSGAASVRRGPLWYSLRIEEEWRNHPDLSSETYKATPGWPNWEVHPASAWNYGLVLDNAAEDRGITPEEPAPAAEPKGPVSGEFATPWTLWTAPVGMKARGKRIPAWKLQNECFIGELQQSPIASEEPEETIHLVPMGCARLRIGCFPVIGDAPEARSWQEQPESVDPGTMPPNRFDAMYPREEPDQ